MWGGDKWQSVQREAWLAWSAGVFIALFPFPFNFFISEYISHLHTEVHNKSLFHLPIWE